MVPCDVEDLPQGVEDSKGGGVVLEDEDDCREQRQHPTNEKAHHPARDPRLVGALAGLLDLPLQLTVAPLLPSEKSSLLALLEQPLRLPVLVPHQFYHYSPSILPLQSQQYYHTAQ